MEDTNRKLACQLKDLKEGNISLQIKETNISEMRNTMEKKRKISEAEMLTVAACQCENRTSALHTDL